LLSFSLLLVQLFISILYHRTICEQILSLAFGQSAYGGHKVRDKKLAFLAFGEMKKIGKTKVYTSYNFILLLQDALRLTNHQLFNKKMSFQYKAPFNILLRYKGEIEQATPPNRRGSEAPNITKNELSLQWSNLLNEVRTFFEQNVQ